MTDRELVLTEIRDLIETEIKLIELGLLENSSFWITSFFLTESSYSATGFQFKYRMGPDGPFQPTKETLTDYPIIVMTPGQEPFDPRDKMRTQTIKLARENGSDLVVELDTKRLFLTITGEEILLG